MTEQQRVELLRDVVRGFARAQKELPPKYFYDERGSELFEEITRLPEYYPTRTERALLGSFAAPWLRASGARALVELGAGNADKTRALLDALPPGATYLPVDISADFLARTAARLRAEYPSLRVLPIVADMSAALPVPPELPVPAVFAFLGSTIGNFRPGAAVRLLARIRAALRASDRLLLGADLVKDTAVLEAAYDDAAGVTAEFNRNVLRVLNRELGSDFDLDAFAHAAHYDAPRRRIEMHLVARTPQRVRIPGWKVITFRRGESIRTEISCKYDRPQLERMLRRAGLALDEWCPDPSGGYALLTARPGPVRRRRLQEAPDRVAAAAAWLRRRHFPEHGRAEPRIGAEYELLVLHAGTHRPAAWAEGRGPLARWLDRHARAHGWRRETSSKGAPRWLLRHGGVGTLEPGGQLEYAAPPFANVETLIADLRAVIDPLYESAAAHGLELLAVGVDPFNPIEHAPLQLDTPRYRRMAEHFARIGSAGARMMRQTASLQVNIDARHDPDRTWCLANALAPYLTALFASSRVYAGADTGSASYRARLWRELDPARTGLLPCTGDPAVEYARFALDAPALLLDGQRFAARTRTEAEWTEHLSTLFPEVRPRGYLELRSLDAVDLERTASALRVIAGLLWHPEAFAAAAEIAGAPDPELLVRAGEQGLEDETLRDRAERLRDLGEGAAAELSAGWCGARALLRR